MESRENVLAALPEREPFPQLGACEDGARGAHPDDLPRLQRERAELVQPEVELVGDVPEIAAAPGGAAIVHLERRDDAVLVDLDRLRVLPADVEDGARAREDAMGAASVAEDLAANRLLRERERLPSVARADRGDLVDRGAPQRDVDGARERCPCRGRSSCSRRHPLEGARRRSAGTSRGLQRVSTSRMARS